MRQAIAILAASGVMYACRTPPRETAAAAQPVAQPAASGSPVLTSLSPDSVRLNARTISEVILRGSGFATSGSNTIRVGPIVLTSVPANAAGTEIRIVVPARYTTNVEAPPRPLLPGAYPVTVETRGLTSASIMLKVIS